MLIMKGYSWTDKFSHSLKAAISIFLRYSNFQLLVKTQRIAVRCFNSQNVVNRSKIHYLLSNKALLSSVEISVRNNSNKFKYPPWLTKNECLNSSSSICIEERRRPNHSSLKMCRRQSKNSLWTIEMNLKRWKTITWKFQEKSIKPLRIL